MTTSSVAPGQAEPPGRRRRVLVRTTLGLWLVSFAAALVWSVANPLWGDPDAIAHGLMAYSVVHEDPVPDPVVKRTEVGTSFGRTRVPRGLVDSALSARCFARKPAVTADCAVLPSDNTEAVDYDNPAGRYLPAYYWVVGMPTHLVPLRWAPWATRVAATALASFFVAWAVGAALTARRPVVAVLGVFTAMTPMVLFLAGAVNPNSLEITGSLAMGAGLMAFLREPDTWLGAVMLRRALVAATVVLLTRPLAPVWVGLALMVLIVLGRRPALRAAWRAQRRGWLALPLVAALVNVCWTVLTQADLPPLHDEPVLARLTLALDRVEPGSYWQQIGLFGWGDTPLEPAVYVRHLVVAVLLVGTVWVLLRTRAAIGVAVLLGTGLVIPVAVQAALYNGVGPMWQGRYVLPLTVLIPVTAFMALSDSQVPAPILRRLCWLHPLGLGVLFSTHVVALFTYLERTISAGKGGLTGPWQPPVDARALLAGQVTLLVLVLALVVLGYRALARALPGSDPAAGPPAGHSRHTEA